MFTVHGAFENPQRAKSYARFSSPEDYATRQEAEQLLKDWQGEKRYTYIWIEGGK